MTENRGAALLLRVWLEDDVAGFRARLTAVAPSESGAAGEVRTVAVASSPRDAVAAVSVWLDEFIESRTR